MMLRFRSGRAKSTKARSEREPVGVAVVPADLVHRAEAAEADGRYLDAIDLLRQANREPDPDIELRLINLRHRAFDEVERADGRLVVRKEFPVTGQILVD